MQVKPKQKGKNIRKGEKIANEAWDYLYYKLANHQ